MIPFNSWVWIPCLAQPAKYEVLYLQLGLPDPNLTPTVSSIVIPRALTGLAGTMLRC
jgi:hypothetical protein